MLQIRKLQSTAWQESLTCCLLELLCNASNAAAAPSTALLSTLGAVQPSKLLCPPTWKCHMFQCKCKLGYVCQLATQTWYSLLQSKAVQQRKRCCSSSCICTCAQLDSQHAQCHTMQSQLAARVLKLFVVRTLRERSKLGSSICSSQLKNKRSSLIAELRLGLSVCPKPFIPSAIRVLIIPPPSCHIKSCRHACLAAAAEPIWPHASL